MKKRILVGAVAAALSLPSFAADTKLDLLEKQIAELQKQIADLKTSQAAEAKQRQDLANQVEAQSKEVVMKGDIPGSTRRAGEETSVRLYGFARLDAVHNFGGRNNRSNGGDYAAYQPNIALNGTADAARKNETYMFANVSRLGFEAFTPTALGSLTTKVEGDFYTDSNTMRLRHAYGQVGGWLLGQTWSTFMDLDSSPDVVDFNGPTGNTSLRQPQIRYTYATAGAGNFIAALETKGTGKDSGDNISRTPDLVLRWDRAFDWGHIAVRGLTTDNAIKSDVTSAAKRGYGLGLGNSFKITDSTAFLTSFSYGEGMGRFFNESVGAIADSATSKVYLPRELGMVFSLQHKFSDTLRSTLAYGQQRTYNGNYVEYANQNGKGTLNRSIRSGSIGLLWNPVANIELGSEFMLSHRDTLDGQSGTEPRLNLAATYSFGN
ncbi:MULTISPECIES: DcaP family trimeric outer membrane transporter [Uliginosibacterium]|uniref:Carbohydrate porin n=1 Tax=Uliginosibacterium aquaticum TaxID=2731212 RepID=A0ABX2IHY3_9RHOO|nr:MULTISPECIES: DcaP family trimeric outer membrane transporter [Uliginosibacterium]MDO6387135.1 DcaP family trimeric outer membrane transporter [Uliginosibacterium sp. 31-12]NSL56102.1 carbohydrate porin [Uliginosibacterium aquaticum]PLK50842.1 hypothetical protein C0V76_03290 [Uliginosibacterium sp. TH139]